jgi:hypothetical protein
MNENDQAKELSPEEMQGEPDPATVRSEYEPTEMTTWDGTGNPIKHVITEDDSGFLSEGTGPTTEEATKSAKDPDQALGEDAGPS